MTKSNLCRPVLEGALALLLGKDSAQGSMAFVRCLPAEVIESLIIPGPITIPGWQVLAVAGRGLRSEYFITSDQAVDIRESKKGNVLLLVDQREAGVGMDGIYSAVREIPEQKLFETARKIARKQLTENACEFAEVALKQARGIGKTNAIAPWRESMFYSACVQSSHEIGQHVSLLGLWPIQIGNVLRPEDCEIAARVVERLLLPDSPSTPVHTRIDSLLLPDDATETANKLEVFLRENRDKRWTDVVLAACEHPDLWLNSLKPGFVNQELKSIELVNWRPKKESPPHKWSGLTIGENNTLSFFIDENNRSKSKLEVRWKTQPTDLKAGAVEYEVTIESNEEDLVTRKVTHNGKDLQKCVFADEDFENLDEGGKWDAHVCVRLIGEERPDRDLKVNSLRWKETELFTLNFGTLDAVTKSSSGRKVRAMVEDAIKLEPEEFDDACRVQRTEDARGFVSYRVGTKSGLVYRPPLLKLIEETWKQNNFPIGRWIVQVRPEGSRVRDPEFIAISLPPDSKLDDITRQMAHRTLETHLSFVAAIYKSNDLATSYVNAWAVALESESINPQLALAHTLEVQSLQGKTIGLIVLPSHPLRVAWHQAYDELAWVAHYDENLKATDITKTLSPIDGSYFPAFLPGLTPNSSFVFGDILGFYTVAMLHADDQEPQASIALLARCLSPELADAAPSVGITSATAISREIEHYLKLHPDYLLLRLHALRAGDGRTVTQAMGQAIQQSGKGQEYEDEDLNKRAFSLDLYPSQQALDSRMVGRYITEVSQKRRAGVPIAAEDQWMLRPVERFGMQMPRLRWAKRKIQNPNEPAHLSIAFDTFESTIEAVIEESATTRPIETFGLYPSIARSFSFEPVPTWTMTLAMKLEGERHPAGKGFSDRLHRIHSAIARAVATNIGGAQNSWPVLTTRLNATRADALRQLHELSDWVITVDRNAGTEYFDSPRQAEEVYNTYVIDCVPERQDLDCVRLVTSTSNIEEVKRLLNTTLDKMMLSCSPRNCESLLARLKAISGRLAMRLTHRGNMQCELVALAKLYEACDINENDSLWFSLKHGFFVPLDDVRELLLKDEQAVLTEGEIKIETEPELRADLMYVSLTKRGGLQFSFVEVKYRRILKDALDPSLHERIAKQTQRTRQRWQDSYFSTSLTRTQLAIRRKRCARALLFYLEKAHRHALSDPVYEKLVTAIEKLFRLSTDVSMETGDDRGYIFCPEHSNDPRLIDPAANPKFIIFGPQTSTEPAHLTESVNLSIDQKGAIPVEPPKGETKVTSLIPSSSLEKETPKTPIIHESLPSMDVSILLGNRINSDESVNWEISIKGNPHMMIVGQPGMGKTNAIINICQQFVKQGVTPIVFAFHDDIEMKLSQRLGQLRCVDLDNGLGFNPMKVINQEVNGWLDTVGMLRDIFWSIYPDFGELQANEIREAIKKSFEECDFGQPIDSPNIQSEPQFARFYEILKSKAKPNKGVLSRLTELADYGFFRSAGTHASLLSINQPAIIRLYASQNEELQNAMASFALLNLYQNMFVRGLQPSISHVVIFDEAHRASRLKLIPKMAKECRKYGIGMIVASQEAKDFSPSLFAAIANYLVLRVTEIDAKSLAKIIAPTGESVGMINRLKQLQKYAGVFWCEGQRPIFLHLKEA